MIGIQEILFAIILFFFNKYHVLLFYTFLHLFMLKAKAWLGSTSHQPLTKEKPHQAFTVPQLSVFLWLLPPPRPVLQKAKPRGSSPVLLRLPGHIRPQDSAHCIASFR